MAVFRVEKTRDYTNMSNYHLKEKNLTLKSKGLLSMMLSLPDEWNYTTRGLAAICKEGVDSIGAALRELEAAGYIIRRRLRDEKGKITDIEYTIYERPQKPDTVDPYPAAPDASQPYTEKPAQLITNRATTHKSSPNQNITYGSKIHQSIYPGCLVEQQAKLATRPTPEAAPSPPGDPQCRRCGGQSRRRTGPEPADGYARHEERPQPRLGGSPAGPSCRLDFPGWPAGRGAEQFDWEPPRVIPGGGRGRTARLKMLGNMVMPYQAKLLFEEIVKADVRPPYTEDGI